ncbi:glycosyltransferase [Geodermatophilus sp. SYSU D01176]
MAGSISVVVTALGEAPHFAEALTSVAAQTHGATEVIVVSDRDRDLSGSTIPLPALRHLGPGATLADCLRTGLDAARGSHVQFLGADEVLSPVALAAGLACAQRHPAAAFVHGTFRLIDAEGRPSGPRRAAELGEDPYTGLLEGRVIDVHAVVLYRRDLLRALGGFRMDLAAVDYDAHLRLARAHPVVAHGTETARRRDGGDTVPEHRARLDELLRAHRQHRPAADDPATWQRAWRTGERRLRDRYARESLDRARSSGEPALLAALATARLSPRLVVGELAGRALARGARALPGPVGNAVARRHPELRRLGVGAVRLGDLDRTTPVSHDFGFDRGLPVDRYYIEGFLDRARAHVHGRVLEVGDAAYSERFGGDRVERQDVVHVHAGNPLATIVGDISRPGTLPRSAFDCIVLTQTLHLVWDMAAAVRELHVALKPGGVLLLTVPGISPIDRGEWGEQWYWALTPAAVRRLLGEVFGEEAVTVESHGNAYAATAFLQGLALQEVDPRKLDVLDEAYPVIVTAHATWWPRGGSDDVGEGTLGAVEVDQPADEHGGG